MNFSFKEWIKRKPVDPKTYYLTQSNIAIFVSMMFLIFLIGYSWVANPLKIVTTPNEILLPYMTIEVIGKVIAKAMDSVLFGVYDFTFGAVRYSFLILSRIAFWGVPLFMLLSLILGVVAGVTGKNKKVLIAYILFILTLIISAFFLQIYIYFIFVIVGLILNCLLLRKKNIKSGDVNE